jgi:hypothetical protein
LLDMESLSVYYVFLCQFSFLREMPL